MGNSNWFRASKMPEEKNENLVSVESPEDVGEIVSVTQNYKSQWRYNSPLVQVLFTSMVAFGCPGMFNSLTGLGGGGQVDTQATANGNSALYAISSFTYLFVAPIVYHYLGPRWSMFIGGFMYPLYGSSLLAYNHIQSDAYVVATSAILGIGAPLFWNSQGAIATSAPLASEKGRMIGIFWTCFNMGGVIGDFIAMGINWSSTAASVSDATYAVFIALMGAGWLSSLLVTDTKNIIRANGSRVGSTQEERPNVLKDFVEILKILPRKETLVMIPFFFMANYFYSYQQNTVNARLFDVRTRGFNGAFYWLAQMLAAPLFGWFLDSKRLGTRKRRGWCAYIFIFVFSLGLWGGGLAFQLKTPPDAQATGHYEYMPASMDLITSHVKFAGPFVLYFFYGAFDALWQVMAYWLIGAQGSEHNMNEDQLLVRYVGLYKAMQSVGAAIAWKTNADGINYDKEFGINWGMITFSLLVLSPIFWWLKEPEELTKEAAVAENAAVEILDTIESRV